MSKFSELLDKGNKKEEPKDEYLEGIMDKQTPKQTAFANLKKTVADQSSAATAGEDTPHTGTPVPEVSSPKSFKFNLNPSKAVPKEKVQLETGVAVMDSSLQQTATPDFSEKDAAKDFQSADQPDQYTDVHVKELKQALDILKNSIDNKELVADALKNIMINLKKHTFLSDILLPEDCQLMVIGLRESYGVTIAKKQSKKSKRDATTQDVDQVLDQLADLDLQI